MGGAIFLVDLVFHFAVHHDLYRLITVRADRIDCYADRFFSQVPLHEGRGNGIDRSGGINFFAAAERQLMRCFVSANRIGPEDLTFVISYQKKKIFLQIIENRGRF